MDFDYLSDTTEQTSTRFITFITPNLHRFDLAITSTSRFYGKKMVTNLQSNVTAIIGPDDLEEEGYLEHVFRISEEAAEDLRDFLVQVVGAITFDDH